MYVVIGPILHLPYALAIAALTGILEIIPLVGPLIATAIAGTDAFAHGGAGLALAVVAFYFVVRQVEDQVVMPVVVGRAVHLHPVVTIFAVLVGLSTYGVLGGLLGVPIAAAVNVIFRELGEPEARGRRDRRSRLAWSRSSWSWAACSSGCWSSIGSITIAGGFSSILLVIFLAWLLSFLVAQAADGAPPPAGHPAGHGDRDRLRRGDRLRRPC